MSILHPARFPSRLSTARRRRGRRSDPNRVRGRRPYPYPNDRSSRGAPRGSAWFPARASRARASGSSPRLSPVVPRSLETLTLLPLPSPGVRPGGGSRLSRRQRTGPRLRARADRGGLESMDARRGESGGHPPLRVHEDDDVPLASGPPRGRPRALRRPGGRPLRRTRSKTGSGSLGDGERATTDSTHSGGESSDGGSAPTRRGVHPFRRRDGIPRARPAPQVPPSLGVPSSGASIALPPASINPSRSFLRSSGGAARSTTLWVSAAVLNSQQLQLCRIFSVMSVFVLCLQRRDVRIFSAETRRSRWARGACPPRRTRICNNCTSAATWRDPSEHGEERPRRGRHGAGTATDRSPGPPRG